MLWIVLGLLGSYLIGSIPTAYIFGRLLKGIDIRKFGSGNIGATNALRVLGKRVGVTVLVLDVLKGFIAVNFLGNFIASRSGLIAENTILLVSGVCCVCGHNWTVFLKFKGGKGIATTLGVLLALAIKISGLKWVLVSIILIWFLTFIITRIVSVASLIAAAFLPVFILILRQPKMLFYLSILLSVFVVLRHKANLKRIIKKQEPRL